MTHESNKPVDTKASVVAALHELGIEVDTILPVHDLYVDLGLDSTELVELGMIVRENCRLGIRLDLASAITVQDIIEQVESLVAAP